MILGIYKAAIRVVHRILAGDALFDFILGPHENVYSTSNEKYLGQIFPEWLTKTQISPFIMSKILSILTNR